jgi:hypothetical protein
MKQETEKATITVALTPSGVKLCEELTVIGIEYDMKHDFNTNVQFCIPLIVRALVWWML